MNERIYFFKRDIIPSIIVEKIETCTFELFCMILYNVMNNDIMNIVLYIIYTPS
jgi:hypothetical protein